MDRQPFAPRQPSPQHAVVSFAPGAGTIVPAKPISPPPAPPVDASKRVIGRPFEKGHKAPPGAGRPRSSLNTLTKEIRTLARTLLEDEAYLRALKRRLRAGTAGAVEPLLYHYAWGKPTDRVKLLPGTGNQLDLMMALGAAWAHVRGVRYVPPAALTNGDEGNGHAEDVDVEEAVS